MDEKDNKETPDLDKVTDSSASDEQKITVNVTSSEDKKDESSSDKSEATSADEDSMIEGLEAEPKKEADIADTAKDSEEPEEEETKKEETEEPAEEEAMPAVEEPVKEEAPKEEPVTPPVQEPTVASEPMVDDGPVLTPSVQPMQAAAVAPPTEIAQLKKRNKKLKIWLVLFVLILVALISAGVVYFNQQNKSNSDTDALKAENAKLQQQLVEQQQNANQQTIDQLNQQIQDNQTTIDELTKTTEEQEATIDEYKTAVKDLQEACGTACSDVEVPSDTSTTTN